ncbi:DUF4112 domain-containing protein [Halogranum rubrum]|uniref:DUF4112 domain-containing protein n=1 Tax=Halogranum salarium B-1 TaxID=1210908 RepID=J2ZYT1_9EURY|nr:DUF4112 domain-containing protein [Halogranum salarium]EJN58163.1 hypothetical protein HSB1_35800 [Halogranum salarium B-1]
MSDTQSSEAWYPATEDVDARETTETLDRLHGISHLLDNAIRIPGTKYRIGLDPLLGLLPVVGDAPTTAMAAYIVVEAAYLGVPRETILRMLFNLVVDATLGSIPVVGDVFDAVWKANARNVQLLEARRLNPDGGAEDRRFLLVATACLLGVLLALGAASTLLAVWVLGELGVGF